MRRHADWVLHKSRGCSMGRIGTNEEWRIDVLAATAVVDALRRSGRTILPPRKDAGAHAQKLDAVDELGRRGCTCGPGSSTTTIAPSIRRQRR